MKSPDLLSRFCLFIKGHLPCVVATVCFKHSVLGVQPTFSMVPVIGATAPPWAPEPPTPARYLGTGTDTCALPSCTQSRGEAAGSQSGGAGAKILPSCLRQRTNLGEEVHRVVQDDQLGARLHAVDGAVQEGGSAFRLHLPSHMVRLFTNLERAKRKECSGQMCNSSSQMK